MAGRASRSRSCREAYTIGSLLSFRNMVERFHRQVSIVRPGIGSRKPLFHDKTIGELLLLVSLVSSLLAFLVTVRNGFQYSGVDLRGRVVAARAIRMGLDPYQYEWREWMSKLLLDPGRRHPGPSRATDPPTLLMLCVPLSGFPYRPGARSGYCWSGRPWWPAWRSWSKSCGRGRRGLPSWRWACFSSCVATSGDSMSSGQFYVFVLLRMSLGTRSLVQNRRDGWLTGIVFGLAAALRPTFFLMALPLAVLGYRKAAAVTAATLGVAIALTLPWVGLQPSASDPSTMRVWEQTALSGHRAEDFPMRTYGPAQPVSRIAEGVDFFHNLPIETGGSAILANFHPVYSGLRWLVASRRS